MDYSDKLNFAHELAQEIKEKKEELALLRQSAGYPTRIKELEESINQKEKLHLEVQEDIHGVEI